MTATPLEELSPGQLAALQNLVRKRAGEEVDWINIADARTLTELGLAERSREGWMITETGRAALDRFAARSSDAELPQTEGIAP